MKKRPLKKQPKTLVIDIPHLGYKIAVIIEPKEFTGRQEGSIMFAENSGKDIASIFFRKKPTPSQAGIVAHEIMHVLQFMCRNRNIAMEVENEHMGYLMQYIFQNIY